jgi:actin beta/gamma 1
LCPASRQALDDERASILPWTSGAWEHAISLLEADPREQPLLLTMKPLEPKAAMEHAVEIAFEKLQVPSCYLMVDALAALYSTGRTSGSVVLSGDAFTHFVPVYEGYIEPDGVKRAGVAGAHLTALCHRLLIGSEHAQPGPLATHVARAVKHQCASALAPAADAEPAAEEHVLPDGRKLLLRSVPDGCVSSGQAFFEPRLVGLDCPPLHDVVRSGIMALDVSFRASVARDIIVCGGSTCTAGFAEALHGHIRPIMPASCKLNVLRPPRDGLHLSEEDQIARSISRDGDGGESGGAAPAPWLGGSILADLSTFQSMWISKDEYTEAGPKIVHSKCF